jgi:hypothetical protein
MKIQQDPVFQPITITIETKAEAEKWWQMARLAAANTSCGEIKRIANDLSNWFSNVSQLGGD